MAQTRLILHDRESKTRRRERLRHDNLHAGPKGVPKPRSCSLCRDAEALKGARLVLDRDCPNCGWPEVVVVHYGDGAGRYECAKACGWTHEGPWPGAAVGS